MKLVLTIVFVFLTYFDFTSASDACGKTWELYKDEHCYKLFGGLRSYDEAEKICQTNNGTLVSIYYAEEQNFLSSYLFTKKKVVDNVWIGAKYDLTKKMFQWADNKPLTGRYSNWATGSPKNLADYCVQMHSDVGSVGKWVDEPCARKNLVVCQKTPFLSGTLLSETVIELKHNLQSFSYKLVETENKLAKTETTLEKSEKGCALLESKLVKAEAALAKLETFKQLVTTKLTKSEETLKKTESVLTKTEEALLKLSARMETAERTLKTVNQHKSTDINLLIPIGFTYVQLPKDKAPSELWPSTGWTWTEISSDYEGVFFRVAGGEAAEFGEIQEGDAPRLYEVALSHSGEHHQDSRGDHASTSHPLIIPQSGWSEGILISGKHQCDSSSYMRFKNTDTEVRPKNMAVKVYRRTA